MHVKIAWHSEVDEGNSRRSDFEVHVPYTHEYNILLINVELWRTLRTDYIYVFTTISLI